MAENDVKRFYWSTYFFDKSKVAVEFLQHRGSKLKLINLERNYHFFRFSTGNTTYESRDQNFFKKKPPKN